MNVIHQAKGYDPETEDVTNPQGDEAMVEQLRSFASELHSEAERRIARRTLVERRWIEDLKQKHGKYSAEIEEKLTKNNKSKLFINQTRSKTNSLSARLSDILFPVDDRNWAIRSTPVPELDGGIRKTTKLLKDASDTAFDAKQRAMEASASQDAGRAQVAEQERTDAEQVMSQAQAAIEELDAQQEEAEKAAELMQTEIEDQLISCNWSKSCRRIIQDACDVGMGVMKGPVVGYKPRPRWKKQTGPDGVEVDQYGMEYAEGEAPGMYRVDYWGYFPDPDVTDPEDGNGDFERHLMNAKQVRQLQRRSDIDKKALRRVLRSPPSRGNTPTYLIRLNEIADEDTNSAAELYHVWEYTGPVDNNQIAVLLDAFGDDGIEGVYSETGEIDPLVELNVRIWFCDGEVLSFGLHPLDTNETLYSIFTLEKDESSPFGFGIPYLIRNPQALLNAAYRMMSDNARLAVSPQVVIRDNTVEPLNGVWRLEGGKIWTRKTGDAGADGKPFETFDIPIHQNLLASMIELATQAIDDASFPAIAQGEQGAEVTKTFQGMAMLINSANVVFRRWVKNFDDGITKPGIRRMYDFNMQFSPKEEIKGDFDVDVRGSSVLLVRELQAQNIMLIVDRYTDHPVYGPMLKERDAFEHLLRSNMLPVNEMLRSETEYQAEMERRRNQPDPAVQAAQMEAQDRERERAVRQAEIESKERLANLEWSTRMRIAEMEAQSEMQNIAAKFDMTLEEVQAKLAIADMNAVQKAETAQTEAERKDRALATEVAMRERTGKSAGGSV